jgi:ankyrin repeat protein
MDKVKTLLSSGAAVRARDHAGNEPLHYAVLSSMADMVQLLVKSGANPDGKGQANRFPLHTAVSKSSLRIIKMLLAQGVDISAQDDLGDTPLHLALPPAVALEPGRVPPIIRVLVEFGCELNKPNAAGITPFLKFLASPHESPACTDREFRAYKDLVLYFLQHGGSVTTPLPDGRTPLQLFLAQCGDDQDRLFNREVAGVLCLFLDRGALVETATASGDPLGVYLLKKSDYFTANHKTLATLVCSRVDTESDLGGGNTALHMVLNDCRYPRDTDVLLSIVELLVQRGGNPNRQNGDGGKPLSILISTSPWPHSVGKILPLLLDHGAEVSQRIIVKAATRFPDADTILRPLLQTYLRQLEHAPAAQEKHATPAEQQWWDGWARAGESGQWRDARRALNLRNAPEIGQKLVLTASAVLAEKLIQDSRDRFRMEQGEKDTEREYVAEILQSYRSLGIPIDMEYFDYLVELCL